jgi:hypothetical protein
MNAFHGSAETCERCLQSNCNQIYSCWVFDAPKQNQMTVKEQPIKFGIPNLDLDRVCIRCSRQALRTVQACNAVAPREGVGRAP